MGRTTVYNKITEGKIDFVNPKNIQLGKDFLDYLSSTNRSPGTIKSYESDLNIFWVWLLEHCENKFFVDLRKREISKFQNYCLNEYKWSSARIRRVKSCLSSLSNFIENILDDEYEDFKPIVKRIENPVSSPVREKTVLTKEQLDKLLIFLVDNGRLDQACMLSLAMNCGKRKAELPRVKVSFFDEKNVIYGSLYKSHEKIKTKGRGSNGKLIPVYIFKKEFQPYLDLWMNFRNENKIESEWLIPHKEHGKYIDKQIPTSTLDSWAESFSRILGVPFYWHCLRHFWTTQAVKSNLPDSVITQLCGWANSQMVNVYNDTDPDENLGKYFSENGIVTSGQGLSFES